MEQRFTNRLIHETSPYLLQHAHNPVDWYPWGEEAFARAKQENKPILLSVGYSACHWCHVMEHESFESEKIAKLMNELFVNIKVDREERPDIDEIYMNAVQMLTGRGGWPMTVFLTPEGKPFYGGTYFPSEDRHGLPAFPRVLAGVAQAYYERPQDVAQSTSQILANLEKLTQREETIRSLQVETLERAAASLVQHVDQTYGGLGGAPKFPNSMVFAFFLRAYKGTNNEQYLRVTTHTLRKMAAGGIYDHLGGGFHRYSVDERWLVPHFEKMLYDNALLAGLYLEAYQVTHEEFFRQMVEDILAYVEREMLHPNGGFYSTQDADSEGKEGTFFIWSQEEVLLLLGEEKGAIFCRYYDVTDVGNFEHYNILHPTLTVEQLAKLFDRSSDDVSQVLRDAKARLFAIREQRVKPGRDEKILTSWNGLMVSAFTEAYKVVGNPRYLEIARKTASFILNNLYKNERLLRSYRDGQAKVNAYLDDYAYFVAALLDLYEATFERLYLDRAKDLTEVLLTRFWDSNEGGFFFTSDEHEVLISRSKSAFDGAVPSGNSVATLNLLRLGFLTDTRKYIEKAEKILRLFYDPMEQNPFGFSHMLSALDFYLRNPTEIVVLGDREGAETQQWLSHIHRFFLPNKTIRCVNPHEGEAMPSFLAGREHQGGKLTAYVCQNFTCSLPVTTWEGLETLLRTS
ncbi:MAG: thioredoxin domain-containing protein [Candidatus Binatia bacterium]